MQLSLVRLLDYSLSSSHFKSLLRNVVPDPLGESILNSINHSPWKLVDYDINGHQILPVSLNDFWV